MRKDGSLPSYQQLFGDLDFWEGDEARSVYSPAAYLVDLLRLLEGAFRDPSLLARRPDLGKIPLDAEHTFTESPYLDIVNEVLETVVGSEPYERLRAARHPFGLPFSLVAEQFTMYLRHLKVAPDEFYRLFAPEADPDVVARLSLGLSAEDVEVVTARRGGARPAAEPAGGLDARPDARRQGGADRRRHGEPGRGGGEQGRRDRAGAALREADRRRDLAAPEGPARPDEAGLRRALRRGRPEDRRGDRAGRAAGAARPVHLRYGVGRQQVGDALDKVADVSSTLAEGFSTLGELLGVRSEQERAAQEWGLQLAMAKSDVTQLGHQVAAAQLQVTIAKRELDVVTQEIANQESVVAFMTDKFAGAQLYHWMAGRMAGLYFQTYNLAYETARSAERAFQFERGVTNGDGGYIQPRYWESLRNGLLAGDSLGFDLERLGKAYADTDGRGMEITKKVSLLDLDPLALLALRGAGRCEFALTEALFDRDFPGHFGRRIRTLSVAFQGADGPLGVYATLTQLDSKTVLEADPKAVKFLLDPKGAPPDTLRADWRSGQQIALSDIEEYKENNGLFELRLDDERYLPFEGTGAISRWRLQLSGPAPADLSDVVVTVKYTADQGGDVFANAVKGMLKPYPTARYFDVAREFPDEWARFQESEDDQLVLSFTQDRFPGMSGRQITGIFPRYELAGRDSVRFLLNGDRRLALNDGKLLRTVGLNVGGNPWILVLEGDKTALTDLGLVLTYRASVQ